MIYRILDYKKYKYKTPLGFNEVLLVALVHFLLEGYFGKEIVNYILEVVLDNPCCILCDHIFAIRPFFFAIVLHKALH